MDKPKISDTANMTGNVQGFELPRGCLMVSGAILLPIIVFVAGLILPDFISATLAAVSLTAALIILRRVMPHA